MSLARFRRTNVRRRSGLLASPKRVGHVALVWACLATLTAPSASDAQEADIPDPNLRAAVEAALGKESGEAITVAEMGSLTELTANFARIEDLTGLELATGLTSLEMDANRIADISVLADLTLLEILRLSSNAIEDVSPLADLTRLESLVLSSNVIEDVSPLAGLTSLSRLSLTNNSVSNLSPLASLTSLTDLYLSSNDISDLTPLMDLELQFLYIENNRITDVSPLANVTSLWVLGLSTNAISDVAPLSQLTQLSRLRLSDNEISNVEPLAGLVGLRSLSLSNNWVSDVSALSALTNLVDLRLSNNGITDISPLSGMTRLEWLYLSSNAIRDFPLTLSRMVYLNLSNNGFSDVSSLARPPSFERLHIANNGISDISPLAGQTGLTRLDLSDNRISDASALADFGRLDWLDFSNNNVVDLSPLEDLRSIRTLYLSGNRIMDVSPLSGLPSLNRLYLSDNAISDMSPLADLTSLWNLDISDNLITNTPPLSSLISLSWLNLSGNRISEASVSGPRSLGNLNLSDNEITSLSLSNVDSLHSVNLADNKLSDLTLLTGAESLTGLTLSNNRLLDLSPLSRLGSLASLNLSQNSLTEIEALAEMTSLSWLDVSNNNIVDASPLTNLESLRGLEIANNQLTDVSALESLSRMIILVANANAITDVGPLARSSSLWRLHLGGNAVTDIQPLVDELESLYETSLWRNPLGHDSLDVHVPALRERGVRIVGSGWRVPVFPPPDGFRQGFVRVVSEVLSSDVWVYGTHGETSPAHLRLPGSGARHFNSDDLAAGNSDKGLYSKPGSEVGESLEVYALEDFEVLAYTRTSDGFVTSMHDPVPWLGPDHGRLDALTGQAREVSEGRAAGGHYIAIFNPASNYNQRSMLRLANFGDDDAEVTIYAVDDSGTAAGPARLTVAANTTTTLTSEELESGAAPGLTGSLGDGKGKWRLVVSADEGVLVMNLMSSPTGHLTNLSTWSASLTVPLFPAASHPQQGFARVANLSDTSGMAMVEGYDDRGVSFGPLTLQLPAAGTVHFNSNDWEFGAPDKALVGAAGTGEGSWRLEFASDLDIVVSAYLRTSDGFLTSMHDLVVREICINEDPYGVVPSDRQISFTRTCELRVPIFNPASNTRQVSWLRLVNGGDSEAMVSIYGIDDSGIWHGPASLALPAGAARRLSAYELESHEGEGITGALGDGEGKWELRVVVKGVPADDVMVMNVLESPTGHLTNLSTWPDADELRLR